MATGVRPALAQRGRGLPALRADQVQRWVPDPAPHRHPERSAERKHARNEVGEVRLLDHLDQRGARTWPVPLPDDLKAVVEVQTGDADDRWPHRTVRRSSDVQEVPPHAAILRARPTPRKRRPRTWKTARTRETNDPKANAGCR